MQSYGSDDFLTDLMHWLGSGQGFALPRNGKFGRNHKRCDGTPTQRRKKHDAQVKKMKKHQKRSKK